MRQNKRSSSSEPFTPQKISKLLDEYQKAGKPFFAFEFFPPKSEKGKELLLLRMQKLNGLNPLYLDIAFGAGGSSKLSADIVELANETQEKTNKTTQIHLTLTGMSKSSLKSKLLEAKEKGIKNILSLRGDPPKGLTNLDNYWESQYDDLRYASDFVEWIKKLHGKDEFCLSVAGYPEGHPRGSYEKDLKYLKQKVDKGADFIITQFFYDVKKFLKFKEDCLKMGITVPIIPGIMPIVNYKNWSRLLGFCKVSIPEWMKKEMDTMDLNDKEMISKFGINVCVRICKELIENGVKGFLFYTLNLSKSVTTILKKIGYLDFTDELKRAQSYFPWLKAMDRGKAKKKRSHENIRPIFWSNRPDSYLLRTQDWDEVPNGPEFFKNSPAFGNVQFHSYDTLFSNMEILKFQKRNVWGQSHDSLQSVYQVFVKFLNGEIDNLPWVDNPICKETNVIVDQLMHMNENGFLTINSQPKANGIPSDHNSQGWDKTGGYIFKKPYLEFFCSAEKKNLLMKIIHKYPSLSFHCINKKEDLPSTNTPKSAVTTVTWAVFPNQEIIQPTIVSDHTFLNWKDEAFALWNSWANIYDDKSEAKKILEDIKDNFFLITIVDNDFINGDIFKIFREIVRIEKGGKAGIEKDMRNECVYCKKRVKKGFRCAKCKKVVYCGKFCQQSDWIDHKKVCNK